jgi:hypothetical protein
MMRCSIFQCEGRNVLRAFANAIASQRAQHAVRPRLLRPRSPAWGWIVSGYPPRTSILGKSIGCKDLDAAAGRGTDGTIAVDLSCEFGAPPKWWKGIPRARPAAPGRKP